MPGRRLINLTVGVKRSRYYFIILFVILDTKNMEAGLPSDKLTKCRGRKIDLLNFTCSVTVPGRRLINLTVGVKRSRYYFIHLTREKI